jgi:hypothetical protein
MANVLAGNAISGRADVKQQELATALRGKQATEIEKFGELEKTDQAAALRYALSTENPILRKIAEEQLKGIVLPEGAIYQRQSLSGVPTELKGNPKYRAPLHYDLGNYISVRDPNDPTKEIQRLPKGLSPEASIRMADEGIGGGYGGGYGGGGAAGGGTTSAPTINQGSPILAKPGVSNMPTLANANPYEEFNKSLVPPSSLPPKGQRKWMEDANSPLTGEAAKQVTGAINTISAIDDYRNLVSEAARTGIVSPTQRAKLDAARNTMNLLGKEAYNLGVLNGPDLDLMNSLTVDFNNPKSLLVGKETLDKLIEKQRNVMGTTVQNVYGTQQKKIPNYVIDKLKPAKIEKSESQVGKIEKPSTVDEVTWNYMTPKEKALFATPGKR